MAKMNYTWLFILVGLAVGMGACESILLKPEAETDPVSLFEETWAFADQEYSFFDYKNIDWQAVYETYRPQISPSMNEPELFDVLADMLFVLRDGHVNLTSQFDRSRNWEWYLNSPENYNGSLLERSYFNREEQYAGPFILYDFGDVGYMSYRSFGLPVGDEDIDYVINLFKDKNGIIIDVRNNGGGSIGNVNQIASRFTELERLVSLIRYKSGPEHNEFGPVYGINLSPKGPQQFTKPVVVLTNRKSYSATNLFASYMLALPNVTLVGDTSGGGGGAPSYTELANGWSLRVSTTQTFTPEDNFNIEDGVPPEIRVDMDPNEEAEGIDSILERALEELR